jgi:hypothetical protein
MNANVRTIARNETRERLVAARKPRGFRYVRIAVGPDLASRPLVHIRAARTQGPALDGKTRRHHTHIGDTP